MTERPLIFLSHASRDKPRIAHLVNFLLDEQFRLFIDHPESIPGFTREVCLARGIESLWTADHNNWPTALEEALRRCDCVLVVASDALAPENLSAENRERIITQRKEWIYEINFGQAYQKLAAAKIGKFDVDALARIIGGTDAQDVSPDRDPEKLATSLEILARNRIPAAIASGKRRGGDEDEKLGRIAELLPLCVGRHEQRKAVMRSLALLRQTKRIHPVLIAGPRNELPHRFLEALAFGEGDERGRDIFSVKKIVWPKGRPSSFAEDYGYNLADEVCRDGYAGMEAVARQIDKEGHTAILRTPIDLAERDIKQWMIGEWLEFWEANQEAFSNVKIVPVVSLFLGDAKPGWSECPPRKTDDEAAWTRNNAALDFLKALEGPAETRRYVQSPITEPIRRTDAAEWAENIHQDLVDYKRRRGLEDKVEALYDSPDSIEWGINHKDFHRTIADWLGGAEDAA